MHAGVTSTMGPFIHLIADYGAADPAFSEVVHRLTAADPEVRVQTTAVPPLSTVATGFWIEQLGLHNPPFDGLLVYSNTAPRTADSTGTASGGGPLCFLELDTGVPVVAVDAGYNLSFVRDHVEAFREVDLEAGGSQFRSRDFFPGWVVEIANGDRGSLGAGRSIEDVPERPRSVVCHVDGYGNVKTSIRASEFDLDRERVSVEIAGEASEAVVREAVPAIEADELALVPGSAGGGDPYLELFRKGGSAAAAVGHPRPGDRVTVA